MSDENTTPETNEDPNGGDTSQTAATEGQGNKKQKVEFSPEQQALIDALLDKQFGKGMGKAKAELEPQLTALNEKVTALTEQITKLSKTDESQGGEGKEGKGKKKDEAPSLEIQQLQARLEEMQQSLQSVKQDRDSAKQLLEQQSAREREVRVKDEFMQAVKGIEFFDPSEVFTLIRKDLDFDEDGNVIIKNPRTGGARMNSSYEPMTLQEYLAEFAEKRPYMVKSPAGSGTGSGSSKKTDTAASGSAKNEKARAEQIASMSPTEFEALLNKITSGERVT